MMEAKGIICQHCGKDMIVAHPDLGSYFASHGPDLNNAGTTFDLAMPQKMVGNA